jgi:hypothetical protein
MVVVMVATATFSKVVEAGLADILVMVVITILLVLDLAVAVVVTTQVLLDQVQVAELEYVVLKFCQQDLVVLLFIFTVRGQAIPALPHLVMAAAAVLVDRQEVVTETMDKHLGQRLGQVHEVAQARVLMVVSMVAAQVVGVMVVLMLMVVAPVLKELFVLFGEQVAHFQEQTQTTYDKYTTIYTI